jgi:hypothetical protein
MGRHRTADVQVTNSSFIINASTYLNGVSGACFQIAAGTPHVALDHVSCTVSNMLRNATGLALAAR